MSQQTQGILFALIGFGVYALHDVLIKLLGGLYSPFQIVFFSVLFAFPLTSLMLIRDTEPATLRPVHPWWMAVRMLVIMIASAASFYAFSALPLADTYAILFSMPILVTLLSIPLLGERIRVHRGIAVLVGLAGVVIVLRPGESSLTLGHLAALVGASCSALGAVIMRKIGRDERNVTMLLYPTMATFVVMGATMPAVYRPMEGMHFAMMATVSVLAFAGMLFMIMAYKRAEAALVAPMQYSQIIWAVFYGWLIFDDWPGLATMIGVSLIIASGLYIVFRETRAGASRTTPVLETRSRSATPGIPRVSLAIRLLGRKR